MSGSRRRLATALTGVSVLTVATALVLGLSDRGSPAGHLPPLTAEVPNGYVLDPSSTGDLNLRTAASVTVLPTDVLHGLLAHAGFQAGYIRRWTRGEQYADVLVLRTRSQDAARQLVAGALDYVMGLPGGGVRAGKKALFAVPSVPGAQGFFANGSSASTGSPLFVQGVWFTRGKDAFLTETGSPQPGDTALAVALAEHQDAKPVSPAQ